MFAHNWEFLLGVFATLTLKPENAPLCVAFNRECLQLGVEIIEPELYVIDNYDYPDQNDEMVSCKVRRTGGGTFDALIGYAFDAHGEGIVEIYTHAYWGERYDACFTVYSNAGTYSGKRIYSLQSVMQLVVKADNWLEQNPVRIH